MLFAELPQSQGNRTLNCCKTSVDVIQDALVPAGAEPFAADVLFDRRVALENCQCHSPKGTGDFRAGPFANATRVFCKCYIQHPVLTVFYAPVTPQMTAQRFHFRSVVRDEEHRFLMIGIILFANAIDHAKRLRLRPTIKQRVAGIDGFDVIFPSFVATVRMYVAPRSTMAWAVSFDSASRPG